MEINPYQSPQSRIGTQSPDIAVPLWNPDTAGLWSLLLTPIFGSVLILKNWQMLENDEKIKASRLWTIISILMLIPTMLIPFSAFIYIIIWYILWQRKQTKYIKDRWGKDYPKKGWGKPLLIGFGVLIPINISVGILFNLLQST